MYTLCVFTLGSVMFVIPQPAYFLMRTVMGLSEELAQQSLTPLVISTFICQSVSKYKLYFQHFLCDFFFTFLGKISYKHVNHSNNIRSCVNRSVSCFMKMLQWNTEVHYKIFPQLNSIVSRNFVETWPINSQEYYTAGRR